MKIRVINSSTYDEFCEDRGIDPNVWNITDEQFMECYEMEGGDWEFDSIKAFCDEFNSDGPYAPTSTDHIIRFFENE